MKTFKTILLALVILLVGGIVLQAVGFINVGLFRWFTNVKLYK